MKTERREAGERNRVLKVHKAIAEGAIQSGKKGSKLEITIGASSGLSLNVAPRVVSRQIRARGRLDLWPDLRNLLVR